MSFSNQTQVTNQAQQRIIMQAIEQVEKQYQDSSLLSEDKNREKLATQGRWTQGEHSRFIEALSLYGKNWKKVEEHIRTRSGAQIRSHAQKFFNRLERETNMPINGLKSGQIKSIFEERFKQQTTSKQDSKEEKLVEKVETMANQQSQEVILKQENEVKSLIEQELNSFFHSDINELNQMYSMITKSNYSLSNIMTSINQQVEEKNSILKNIGMGTFQPPYLAQILQGQEKRDRKLSDLIDINCDNQNKVQSREAQGRSRKGSFMLCQDQDSTQLDKYESLKKSKLNQSQNIQENQDSNGRRMQSDF